MTRRADRLRALGFWYGRIFNTDDGLRLQDLSDISASRALELVAGLGTSAVWFQPPGSLVLNDAEQIVEMDGFVGVGREADGLCVPMEVYEDQEYAGYGTAQEGSVGSTAAPAGGTRTVVMVLRYAKINNVETEDAGGSVAYSEVSHGVSQRWMASEGGALGTWTEHGDLGDALLDGALCACAILRTDGGADELRPLYHPLNPLFFGFAVERGWESVRGGRGGAYLVTVDGEVLGEEAPSLGVLDEGGGDVRVVVDDEHYSAFVGGRWLNESLLNETLNAGLKTTNGLSVGTHVVRLRWSGFPQCPRLYLSDGSNLPAARGDAFASVPASEVGEEGGEGAFESTAHDLVMGVVAWDGASATFTPVVPCLLDQEIVVEQGASYTERSLVTDSNLAVEVTPAVACGTGWEVRRIEIGPVDDTSFPANRGCAHGFTWQVDYTNYSKIVVRVYGRYLNTTGGTCAPIASGGFFRPPVKIVVGPRPLGRA